MEKNKNTLGICKLCGEERELCDSHIFSKFIFKYMAINETKSQYYVVNLKSEPPVRRDQGGLKEYLLCRDCDTQLGVYENYAKGFIDDKVPTKKIRINNNLLKLSGVNYAKLKLFILSILWRASVSSLNDFKKIRLGPYEEKIKALLLTKNPGAETEYPVILGSLKGNWKDFILKDQFQINQRRCYRFFLGGFCWMILVTNQTIPEGLEHFILRENGEALVVQEEASNTELMPEFSKQLKEKGVFVDLSTPSPQPPPTQPKLKA